MLRKKRHPYIALIHFFLFFLFLLLHYTDAINLSVRNATPLLLLPLLVAYAMFSTTGAAAAVGFLTGVCMDAVASRSVCFHAVFMMTAAAAVSVISNRLFNKNLLSAVVQSLGVGFLYYTLRWFIFYAFHTTLRDNLFYLLRFAFPSILYTELFIFPFYYLCRALSRLKSD